MGLPVREVLGKSDHEELDQRLFFQIDEHQMQIFLSIAMLLHHDSEALDRISGGLAFYETALVIRHGNYRPQSIADDPLVNLQSVTHQLNRSEVHAASWISFTLVERHTRNQ